MGMVGSFPDTRAVETGVRFCTCSKLAGRMLFKGGRYFQNVAHVNNLDFPGRSLSCLKCYEAH